MSELRDKAKGILESELPAGVRHASDGGPRFQELTGYSHATLKSEWAKGSKLTTCMGYVAHYCQRMGITPNLGRFDLDTYLPTIQKEHTWVRAAPGRKPQVGDILLHATTLHIDVAMGFDGNVLIRGASGQGIVGQRDVVARVRGSGPFNVANLKGWVDLERYFAERPSNDVAWLKGWWKVWDGNTYYYYFGAVGFVQYTKTPPGGQAPPPKKPLNQGDYELGGNKLVITWNPMDGAPTVETFHNANAGARQMNATSNRYSPLVAQRL
ncbi:MAG: hypothetical protein HY855_08705 [Burkholderiales bacterium]|nr:hypothetical protein [Burkholderiales bacterium]